MSDPVTNAEVEDVLSSIRRLVSEEKRPLQAAQPAPQPAASEPQADRLVLTPALRVAEDVPDATDDAPEGDTPEAAADAPLSAVEMMKSVTQPEAADTVAEDHADEARAEQLAQADPEDDYTSDPYNFADEADADGEAAPLTLTADSRTKPEWAEEDADLPTADDDETMAWPGDVTDDEVDAAAPTQDEIAAADTKAATISAKIEALESALGGSADEYEPDEVGSDPNSGTQAPAMAWEDDLSEEPHDDDAPFDFDRVTEAAVVEMETSTQAEAEPIMAAAMPTEEAPAPEEQGIAFDGEDQLLDEDALRDMVSEIVRAELQGALGERITRNVRKLVRREIHRALTTQDLE